MVKTSNCATLGTKYRLLFSNIMNSRQESSSKACPFCQMGREDYIDRDKLLYQDEELYVVNDRSPWATNHILVVPKNHLPNARYLKMKHIDVVKKMESVGIKILEEKMGASVTKTDLKIGYHLPPLITIDHLHLHILYPTTSLSLFGKYFLFNPSLFFITSDSLLDRLLQSNQR